MKITIEGELAHTKERNLSVLLMNAGASKSPCKVRLEFPEGTLYFDAVVTGGVSSIRHDGDPGAYEFELMSCGTMEEGPSANGATAPTETEGKTEE